LPFDYLMSFPGKVHRHFLPEHMNRISLSFLVDTMSKRRGGVAPNIAYTLRCSAKAAADGARVRTSRVPAVARGGRFDTSLTKQVPGKFCRRFFAAPIWRNNQIASFYTGAMPTPDSSRSARSATAGSRSSRNDRARYSVRRGMRTLGIPYIFDPASSARECRVTS